MSPGPAKSVITWGAPSLWINLFPIYWGRLRGFFRENGIDLKVKYFHGGSELVEAVHKGSIRIQREIGAIPQNIAVEELVDQ